MSEAINTDNTAGAINNPARRMIALSARATGTHLRGLRFKHVEAETGRVRRSHTFAFAGLFVFTLLLYMRPQEMFPGIFGEFPLIRIIAVATLIAYFLGKILRNEHLTILPLELKMLGTIFLLGVAFTPLASAPQDSIDVLLDLFIKVAVIFVLLINVITTREQLRSIMSLVVICGSVLAVIAINSYIVGDFKLIVRNEGFVVGLRIFGPVGGIVGNPNDLATTLDMILPLAVLLAITSRGVTRAFYFVCAAALVGGVIVSFSRGGFLGLVAVGSVLLWKLSRRNRAVMTLAVVMMLGVFALVMPTGYAGRISSIFQMGGDPTGSTQARRDLLDRVAVVALYHPIVGVGMGNYHIHSIGEQVSHNAYLEVAAELGVAGLAAYLILIFAPFRSLRRIERETAEEDTAPAVKDRKESRGRELHYMSIALQAVLIAYIVCSFFGSIQYQWFLYYPVAYAIALRRIHAGEQEATASNRAPAVTRQEGNQGGVLWRRHHRRGGQTSPGSAYIARMT